MAKKKDDDKKSKVIKQVKDVDSKKSAKEKRVRKKPTMRERNVEAAKNSGKQGRVRRASSGVVSGSKRIGGALTRDYHVVTPKEDAGFFMKSRKLAPKYFRNAWGELRQVTWTDFRTTWKLVFAVFVFSVIIGGFIAGLDYLLERAFREVIL